MSKSSSPSLTPDLEALLRSVCFADSSGARARLQNLAGEPVEMLALAQVSNALGESLQACANADRALNNLDRFVHARGARLPLYQLFAGHPAALHSLVHVLAGSQYLADALVRNPEHFDSLSDHSLLGELPEAAQLEQELNSSVAALQSAEARLNAVRRFKRRHILRIGAADLLSIHPFETTTHQLSLLAEVVVRQCLDIVAAGPASPLIVFALGKLGGVELNYSSDIDLVFVGADAEGLNTSATIAQSLTKALSAFSEEGFLYRVDLRLRPHGRAGPMVISAEAFEDYLGTKADPAERQAMLRARPLAGDTGTGQELLERLQPSLFFDPAQSRRQVRRLKERIEKQLGTNDRSTGHVKLARGGIRDIEFIAQALQLEHGSVYPHIRTGHTMVALTKLSEANLLPARAASELRDAYVFLRSVEHRMQLMNNQQVHQLPKRERELRTLARSLGFLGEEATGELLSSYQARTDTVRHWFDRILTADLEDSLFVTQRFFFPAWLRENQPPPDIDVIAQKIGDERWMVLVCVPDRLGVLSLIAGLFARHGISILQAEILTRWFARKRESDRRARGRAARMRIHALDLFEVSTTQQIDQAFWAKFQQALADLISRAEREGPEAAREMLLDEIGNAALVGAAPDQTLEPVALQIDNDTWATATELRIQSRDTPGFLFEFVNALALLNVNIEKAQIRTLGDQVQDRFLVTDARGEKITDAQQLSALRVAAVLIKQFTHLLPRSPNPGQALKQFGSLTRNLLSQPDRLTDLESLAGDSALRTLADLMGVSKFLWEDFLRIQHENLFPVIRNAPALDEGKDKKALDNELGTLIDRAADDEKAKVLNDFKDREMFRIDLRHITGRIDLEQFALELSDLAETVVDHACRLCHRKLQKLYGRPLIDGKRACLWSVLALGKFGGRELGFASDIELIFVYEGEGETHGQQQVTNSHYFEEFVSEFLRTIHVRREGIFEIDLRLRPHGKAGTLACSLESFAQYFSESGDARQFERLALVKLRLIVGNEAFGKRVMGLRDDLVYSGKPLDYENILHLRKRQADELVPSGEVSAKHSAGGLVDVEYFVQSRQIEAGASNTAVRVNNTIEAIEGLAEAVALHADLASEIKHTYGFFRRLIEALRVVRGNVRDSTIPPREAREFAFLARRLHFESPQMLAEEIDRRSEFARGLWMPVRARSVSE